MQLEFFDVPSPCVGVCQSDEKGYCLGCMRTRDERKEWSTFNNDGKRKVIKLCIQRKKRQRKKALAESSDVLSIKEEPQPEQPSLFDLPVSRTVSTDDDLDFGDFEL